jgi:hypothetical protein
MVSNVQVLHQKAKVVGIAMLEIPEIAQGACSQESGGALRFPKFSSLSSPSTESVERSRIPILVGNVQNELSQKSPVCERVAMGRFRCVGCMVAVGAHSCEG